MTEQKFIGDGAFKYDAQKIAKHVLELAEHLHDSGAGPLRFPEFRVHISSKSETMTLSFTTDKMDTEDLWSWRAEYENLGTGPTPKEQPSVGEYFSTMMDAIQRTVDQENREDGS